MTRKAGLAFLFASTFLPALAPHARADGGAGPRYRADARLLDLRRDNEHGAPYAAPFAAFYKDESVQLAYVAVEHAAGKDSPTFKLVKSVFEDFKPDFVLIEGQNLESESRARGFVKRVERCGAEDFAHCSEPEYAASFCIARNVPFEGAEPSEKDVLDGVERAGYSLDDLLGFYMVRPIQTLKTQGSIEKGITDEKLAARLYDGRKGLREQLGGGEFTLDRFWRWYREHVPQKSLLSIDGDDVMPSEEAGATYLQRVSLEVNRARESSIVRNLQDALDRHRRVLVVFGAWHYFTERPVIEKMFRAPPSFAKPQ